MMKASSIAVDLDGTLAKHTPGKFDPEVIGAPVPRMMSRVKRWLKDGEVVKIFTARASQAKNIPPIKKWLKQHGILGCEITNEKTPDIEKFYDDRAVAVELNTGKVKSAGAARVLLRQWKLSPQSLARLRAAKMLPSPAAYARGLERGNKNLLKKLDIEDIPRGYIPNAVRIDSAGYQPRKLLVIHRTDRYGVPAYQSRSRSPVQFAKRVEGIYRGGDFGLRQHRLYDSAPDISQLTALLRRRGIDEFRLGSRYPIGLRVLQDTVTAPAVSRMVENAAGLSSPVRILIAKHLSNLGKRASAKGIPSRKDYGDLQQVQQGDVLDYVIQRHLAQRAGCFSADARVSMADGTFKPIAEVQVGDSVLTAKGIDIVHHVWNNGVGTQWLELRIGNMITRVTPSHGVFVAGLGFCPAGWLDGLEGGLSEEGHFQVTPAALYCLREKVQRGRRTHSYMRKEVWSNAGAQENWQTHQEDFECAENRSTYLSDAAVAKIESQNEATRRSCVANQALRRTGVGPRRNRSDVGLFQDGRIDGFVPSGYPEAQGTFSAYQNSMGGGEQLQLERWNLQRSGAWFQRQQFAPRCLTRSISEDTSKTVSAVREEELSAGDSPCSPVSTCQEQRESEIAGHKVPCTFGESIQVGRGVLVCFKRLSRTEETRYDLHVGTHHTYFVQGLLVHNSHYDLRMGGPGMGLFSWASRKGVPHEPGEKTLAVRQPLHSYGYRNFEGEIPRGQYGGGTVSKVREGKLLITRSSPNAIHFTEASSPIPRRFILIKPKGQDQNWLLARDQIPEHPGVEKESYKVLQPAEAVTMMDTLMEKGVAEPKVDGALAFLRLSKGRAEIVSHRLSKRTGGAIPHTERMFGHVPGLLYPKKFEGRTFKGEIYGERKGKAIPPQELGGILNAGIARSLEKQKEQDVALRMLLFGQGSEQPYDVSRAELEELLGYLPANKFKLPEDVRTAEEASRLLEQIQTGKHPLTREGMVIHPAEGGTPIKVKFRPEQDVFVQDVYPGEGKYEGVGAGGFRYSRTPEGPIVGNVGSGLSDELRRELLRNPELYFGRRARVSAQEAFPSGALRAPSLIALHEG